MIRDLHSLMVETVNEQKKTYDEDNLRNFTDAYIKQIKASNDPGYNGMLLSVLNYFVVWTLL